MVKARKLFAGNFSVWLSNIRASFKNSTAVEVPCGDCRACCKSSLFVHIASDETQTINRIDKRLLFPTPGLPEGNFILGFSSNGQCPVFKQNACSIYEFRPVTCRLFDCRIFKAAGLEADSYLKEIISQQAERWEFSFPGEKDKKEFKALRESINFIKENRECFPRKRILELNSELAVIGIKVYKVFLRKSPNKVTKMEKHKVVELILKELNMFDKAD